MAKDSLHQRQAELDTFARRKGWKRGAYKSWSVSRLTIAVASSGWPRAQFIAIDRGSAERRKFTTLEDLERFVSYVQGTGRLPAVS